MKENKRRNQERFKAKEIAEGWKVYYLPEEHYCGITRRLSHRMGYHRTQGHIPDNYRVLACYETKAEARHHENLMHSFLGCNGMSLQG